MFNCQFPMGNFTWIKKMWRARYLGLVTVICSIVTLTAHGAEIAILRNGFSIRHDHRQVIESITRLYLGAGNTGYVDVVTDDIERFEEDLTPSTPEPAAAAPAPPALAPASSGAIAAFARSPRATRQNMNDLINSISEHHHLDPDLINSVIHAESGFNPLAVSPKGAQGLMQLMPKTSTELGVSNAFDPQANVEGGTRYLRELLERYDFDLIKALAAYNAGPERVEQYRGVPPYQETRAYVARIVKDFNRKKLAEKAKTKNSAAHKTGSTQAHSAAGKAPDAGRAPVVATQQSE
jgi:Transglycosylase SLT domain